MDFLKSDVASVFCNPALPHLLQGYAEECANPYLSKPNPDSQTYLAIESSGILDVYSVVDDGSLVGFATVLRSIYPHYGLPMTTVESIYVSKEARAKGAGGGLLSLIEQQATGVGLFVSAPVGSQIERVLHGRRYIKTNSAFFLPRSA